MAEDGEGEQRMRMALLPRRDPRRGVALRQDHFRAWVLAVDVCKILRNRSVGHAANAVVETVVEP